MSVSRIACSVSLLLCVAPLLARTDRPAQPSPGEEDRIDVVCPRNVAFVHVLVSITPTGRERAEYIDHPLAVEAREHFAAFGDHPAVGFTEQLFQQMSYHPMNYVALLYSEFPEAVQIRQLPDYVPTDESTRAMLSQYVALLRDFYEVSGFGDFWDAHLAEITSVLDTARANILGPLLPRMMEEFYGSEVGRFVFVASPFMQEAGFHAELVDGENLDFYYFSGGNTYADSFSFNYIAFHEFSHSFVQPVSTRYATEIAALSRLYKPLEDRFGQMGYPTWEHAFEEHMVTAGQLHLTRFAFGDQRAMQMLERERRRGFQLIDRFYGLLAEYSENREQFPELGAFYPVVLADLDRLEVEEYREPDIMGFYPHYEDHGVVVDDVVPASAFARAGVRQGDRIISIGGHDIGSEEAFQAAKARFWGGAKEGDIVGVAVVRKDSTLVLSIAVPFTTRYRYVERE